MHRADLARLGIMILLLTGLSACMASKGTSSHATRATADAIATQQGFQKILANTKSFTLTSYQKFADSAAPLRIYIEGDGRTWITRSKLSNDPTPRNPLALKLAVLDPNPNVAYLARPCQYTPLELNPECQPGIWSDQRFSEKVISAMNQAVDQLKTQSKASKIHLVGFSGGAAIAVLIAARRHDVATLSTIAGDLNHQALTEYHHTTPLSASLNPSAVLPQLIRIPQHHFSGEKDPVVPSFIAIRFVADLKKLGSHCATQMTILGATHHQGWEKAWPQLLNLPFTCTENSL